MKIVFQLFLLMTLVAGCSPLAARSKVPVLLPGCSQPGTNQSVALEDSLTGISYKYQVYLPPCYDQQEKAKYPVFYLIPGKDSGPSAWFSAGANSVADELILSGEVPPFIIVATENPDMDPMGETLMRDLIPQIQSDFRVLDDRRHRAVAGGSLGCIAAYRLAFSHPELFSSAGMFGCGLIHGEEVLVEVLIEIMPAKTPVRVFMDVGDKDTLMLDRAKVMDELLEKMGFDHIFHVGEGGHSYSYWAESLPAYFRWASEVW